MALRVVRQCRGGPRQRRTGEDARRQARQRSGRRARSAQIVAGPRARGKRAGQAFLLPSNASDSAAPLARVGRVGQEDAKRRDGRRPAM